jgi:hypothetical protein
LLTASLALCFYISPEIVIFPGYSSSNFGDEILKSSPEISDLQNWVHPAIDDAIPSIKLSSVMSVVFLMAQD